MALLVANGTSLEAGLILKKCISSHNKKQLRIGKYANNSPNKVFFPFESCFPLCWFHSQEVSSSGSKNGY